MGYGTGSGSGVPEVDTCRQSKVPTIGGQGQRQAEGVSFTNGARHAGKGANDRAHDALSAQDSGSGAAHFGPESFGGQVNKGASGEGHSSISGVTEPFITTKRGDGASTPSSTPDSTPASLPIWLS